MKKLLNAMEIASKNLVGRKNVATHYPIFEISISVRMSLHIKLTSFVPYL